MRHILHLAVILSATLPAIAGEAPFTARAVQITSCAPLPSTVGFEAKPMGHQDGFVIWWLVQGADIIGVKEDSLAVTTLKTPDGKDLAQSRSGRPNWKMGAFPKATADGTCALFSLECSADVFGQAERLAIAGSVVVLTGGNPQTQELPFDPAKPSTAKAGPLTVTFGAKSGFGDPDSYGITVKGPLASIISMEIADGGSTRKSQGWSGMNDERTYHFPKPTAAAPKLALRWWGTSGEAKVELKR